MMEAKLQKQIVDYFCDFEEFYRAATKNLLQCRAIADSINSNISTCREIAEADISRTPLEEYKDIQLKLLSKLHDRISDRVVTIQQHSLQLSTLFEELYTKKKDLILKCKDIDFSANTPLVRGSPFQPALKTLLVYANYTIKFGAHICSIFETSLNSFALFGTDRELPADSFVIPRVITLSAKEIVTYTSCLTRDTKK